MAKPKLVPATAAAPVSERTKTRISMEMKVLAAQATYEIDALASLLCERSMHDHGNASETFVFVARCIGRRIDALNGVLMSSIHNEAELGEDDIGGFELELYGVASFDGA